MTSEDEYWPDTSSEGSDVWRDIEFESPAGDSEGSGSRPAMTSLAYASSAAREKSTERDTGRARRHVKPARQLAEKGVDATPAVIGRTNRQKVAGGRYDRVAPAVPRPHSSSSGQADVAVCHKTHRDLYSDEEVENLNKTDTESDGSVSSTHQRSFAFSNYTGVTESTSMTSVSSSYSLVDLPSPRRKSTLGYGYSPPSPPSPLPLARSPKKTYRPSSLLQECAATSFSAPPTLRSPLPVDVQGVFSSPAPPTRYATPTGSVISRHSSSNSSLDSSASSIAQQISPMGLPPSKTATPLVSSVTPRAEIAHAQPTATCSLTQIRRNDPLGSVKMSKGPAPEAAAVQPSAASTSKGFTASASAIPSVHEGVEIIAHSKEVQKVMDLMQIAWGVQYEIARGVCHGYWTWDDVTSSKLDSLRGSNVMAAPRVARVMLGHNFGRAMANDHPLWTELDREQDALHADPLRGLGLQGEWHGDANWYGGRIQQVSRLVKTDSGSYKLILERMLKRKSNRVARFLGSRRVLQVSVPDNQVREPEVTAVRLFFSQKFVLCGRMFVPFAAKDGKVFMMETNEDHERTPDRRADKNRMSLEDFVKWHNPLDLNGHQPITKWITRFDLGLSTSVPVLRFQGKGIDVFEIPDQYAQYDSSLRKPPTECIFTDGCGFMNGAALAKIAKHLGYSERPTVVQGRFGGAKGLWALHPKDQEPDALPQIWTRPSQQKIRYAELGPAQLIFDLVSPPRVTAPSRLSKLTIMNLSHNGVPDQLFIDLMREGLQKEIDALTTWSSEQDLLLLWNAVNQVGHVTMSMIRRQASGAARILGFGRAQDREDWEDDDGDDGENLDDVIAEKSRNESGGEPVSAAAAVMELLQAGFHPMKLEQLYEKLRQIVAARLEEFIKEFRIVVPESAEAFIIPDPIGVLEEGQIHFRASQNLKDPLEDASPTVITGDVLIYRNPARVPSDIQKVTAVNHPALAAYVNVIILPVKGHRSLANLLAGGDVDGDVCVCIYDANLVKHFHTPAVNDPPPDFMEKNFESEGSIEQVHDLHERLQAVATPISQRELQEVLISGLSDAPVGLYSIFHENAAYAYGYDNPQTLRAAYMFNVVLDSRKTGHRVLNDIFRSDQRKYGRKKPLCMRGVEAETSIYGTMGNPIPRSHGLPPFVLDELLRAGKKLQDAHLAHFEQLKKTSPENRDEDLTRPFEEAAAQAHPVLKNDLDLIDEHVRTHVRQWQQLSTLQLDGSPAKPRVSPKKFPSKPAGKARPKTEKDRLYQQLGESFVCGPDGLHILSALPSAVHTLIASAAYRANVKFAFRFAFRDLCRIKAEASGLIAFTPSFAELMAMPSSAVRVLAQINQDAPHL